MVLSKENTSEVFSTADEDVEAVSQEESLLLDGRAVRNN
jgi:hypothetical protein